MPDEKVLQVAILIWGCAFCAIAALCIFLSSNYPMRRKTPCFSYGDIRRIHRIYASN
ncbi:Uncharacterised protein [uncultured Blautia sp.]|jgi:hypothetical protein|nr:Uncharacterised protein [uncultured Blautia sp.]